MDAAREDIRDNYCDYDGAFEAGTNAARANEAMNGKNHAAFCDKPARGTVIRAYRAGYEAEKERSANYARAAGAGQGYPKKECLEAYGEKACGYDCKAVGGHVKCAYDPGHSCLVRFAGIVCGLNCREEFGEVKCDETE